MKLVPTPVLRMVAHQQLLAQKNSPNVLFGVGVAGMITSTVLACRATLKLEEVFEKAEEQFEDVEKAKKIAENDPSISYTEQDVARDMTIIKVQTLGRVAKLYAPAILVGAASVACLTKSHTILKDRNAALMAAYTALQQGFEQYRARVKAKYGEETDRELRYGTEEVEVVDEKGKKRIETRVGPDGASIYARFFDPLSPSWSRDPEYNFLFLKNQQNYFNDLLKSRGHVFLNEVYRELGIPHSKAGSVVGWMISDCSGESDNYIDFGIFDDNWNSRAFVNGREGSILLDFNVDGVIYDKLDTPVEALSWQMS